MVSSSRLNDSKRKYAKQEPLPAVFEVGDLIVSYLEQIGVERVFGIPGGPIEPLFNALARSARRGSLRPIVARHESGAVFMADGYARETGKLGVCCSTSGPGATNMITGVASAHQDNTPLLVITAQTPLPNFGKGAVQESSCTGVNTVEMLRYCTKYSSLVSHVGQLEWKLASALIAALQHPMGPAHLSIPLDLLRAPIDFEPSYKLAELIKTASFSDPEINSRLCALIQDAKKPVFLIGERCANAIDTILDIATILDAKVVVTPQGKGLVSPYHQQFRGVFGVAGHESAAAVIVAPENDLIVAIGTALEEAATNGWDESSLMTDKLVHVDSTPQYFSRSPMAKYHASGDLVSMFTFIYEQTEKTKARKASAAMFLPQSGTNVVRFERRIKDRRGSTRTRAITDPKVYDLDRRSTDRRSCVNPGCNLLRYFKLKDEHKCYDESSPIKPQRLMYDLSRLFPSNTRFLAEIGNSFLWAIHYLQPFNRRISGKRVKNHNLFLTGMGFSSMGWAIGGAVGVALGAPGAPVVCITGDGSFLMSSQEITVAITEKLPVIYVVLNDASLGTVKHGQALAGAESIGHQLPKINYAGIARAMGVNAYMIESPDDMAALDIGGICRHDGPTLLDVYIDPDEAPPLGERLEMLASGR
jgi:acetolactate synthase-1/2/3 large subunit